MDDIAKLLGTESRKTKMNFRVTDGERKRIEENAEKVNLPVAAYCRKVALGYQPRKGLSEDEIEILKELKTVEHSVNNFNNALKQYSKNMTKEQRTKFILDGRTIAEWGTVIEEGLQICRDIKNKLK